MTKISNFDNFFATTDYRGSSSYENSSYTISSYTSFQRVPKNFHLHEFYLDIYIFVNNHYVVAQCSKIRKSAIWVKHNIMFNSKALVFLTFFEQSGALWSEQNISKNGCFSLWGKHILKYTHLLLHNFYIFRALHPLESKGFIFPLKAIEFALKCYLLVTK